MEHPPREVCKWLGKHYPNLRLAYGGAEQAYLLIQLIPQRKYGTYADPKTLKTPWFCDEFQGSFGKGLERSRIDRGLLYKKNGDIGIDFGTDQIPVIEQIISPNVVFGFSEYRMIDSDNAAGLERRKRAELWAKGKDLQQSVQDNAYETADKDYYSAQRSGYRMGGQVTTSDRVEIGRKAELNEHRSDLTDFYIKRGTTG